MAVGVGCRVGLKPNFEVVLKERYALDICRKLANITHEKVEEWWVEGDMEGEETDIKSQTDCLRRICEDAYQNGGTREVPYKYTDKHPEWVGEGRLYSDCPSMQGIKKGYRGALTAETAIDIDAINCHPTLLLHICKQNGIYDTGCLQDYVLNREAKILDICELESISESEAKTQLIKSFNSRFKLTKLGKKCDWLKRYDEEMKRIQTELAKKFPKELAQIKQQKRESGLNNLGVLTARLLNIEEGKMLQRARHLLETQYIVRSLVFDGLMIDRVDIDGDEVDEDAVVQLLDNCTKDLGIRWAVKPPDTSLINRIMELPDDEPTAHFYGEHEVDLADQIYNHFYKDKLVCGGHGELYLMTNHLWNDGKELIMKHVFNTVTNCLGYIKTKKGEWTLVTKDEKRARSLQRLIADRAVLNKNLVDEIESRQLHKICFTNGYWDFDQGRFVSEDEDPSYSAFTIVKRDFEYIPPDNQVRMKLMSDLFDRLFTLDHERPELENHRELHERAQKVFLYQIARTMAGHVEDKIWFCLQGLRDCGKGAFDTAMRNAFQEYIGSFNTAEFAYNVKSKGDADLNLKFALKNRYKRLATSHEVNGSEWLDGVILKKVSSGGDTIDARGLYKDTVSFTSACKYMFCVNDAPKIRPVDATKTRWFYNIQATMVGDLDDLPNELSNNGKPLAGVQYYLADPNIKSWLARDPIVANALCSILFDAHKWTDVEMPPELACPDDGTNKSQKDEALRLFEFGNPDDKLTNLEIKELWKGDPEIRDSFDSHQKLKLSLRQLGAEDWKSGSKRGLRGVKLRTECLVPLDDHDRMIISAGANELYTNSGHAPPRQ